MYSLLITSCAFDLIRAKMYLSHVSELSEIIEKICELVEIWEQIRFVNPAPECCAETACIYICRGSRCFESSIHKTEQLIIPKYSRRATDDPSRTCCHEECAGVDQAARQFHLPPSLSLPLFPCPSLILSSVMND